MHSTTKREPVYAIQLRSAFISEELAGGVFSFAAMHQMDHLFAASRVASAKRCIVLWMGGGPSQMETFDPKPGTATGGPTESIATPVTGLQIAAALGRSQSDLIH